MFTDITANPVVECDALTKTFSLMKETYSSIQGYVKNMRTELHSFRKQLEQRKNQLDAEKAEIQTQQEQLIQGSHELRALRQQLSDEIKQHEEARKEIELSQQKMSESKQNNTADNNTADIEYLPKENNQPIGGIGHENNHYEHELKQASQQIAQGITERSNLERELKEIRAMLLQQKESANQAAVQNEASATTSVERSQSNSKTAVLGVDPVVDSVLAQFQKVQQDAAKRRIQNA